MSPFSGLINSLKPLGSEVVITTTISEFSNKAIFWVWQKVLKKIYLFLTISLALIIKFKIALEEKYLMNKFKNYLLYKNEVKV